MRGRYYYVLFFLLRHTEIEGSTRTFEEEIPNNSTLFSYLPVPEAGTPFAEQLKMNFDMSSNCRYLRFSKHLFLSFFFVFFFERKVIVMILVSRRFYPSECGEFFGGCLYLVSFLFLIFPGLQKEIVLLIMKYVWRTRKSKEWKMW